jgi:hypothetical protein
MKLHTVFIIQPLATEIYFFFIDQRLFSKSVIFSIKRYKIMAYRLSKRSVFHPFKNAPAFLLRGARHAIA